MSTYDNAQSLITLLQISDSVYPTGGFSHSLGLEAAIHRKTVRNNDDLRQLILTCLENTGSLYIPFVRETHAECWNSKKLAELDKICQACTTNHVANRASIRQGKAMLETSSKAFRVEQMLILMQELPHSHQPIIFGAVCGIMGIDLFSTCTAFMYNALKNVVASAVRLDRIGPIEAQIIQTDVQFHLQDIINRYIKVNVEDACVAFPVIDIVQNTHDTLFSKLFYS